MLLNTRLDTTSLEFSALLGKSLFVCIESYFTQIHCFMSSLLF